MKKIICATTAVLFSALLLNAQQTTFGVKAGINSSSIKIEDGEDYDGKIGLHIGGLAHIHVSQHFAVQPELVYSMQGGESGNTKLKLNYVNIPVLLQYMTLDGFRFQTGPQLGFLASAKSETGDVEIDVKDDLETMDFSWSFGAGYLFSNGLGIDLRYNHGISNISENNNFEARNRVVQLGLFYQFQRGRVAHKR